jgi:hypothetical protein
VGAYGQQLDREMAGYVLEDTRLSTLQRKLSKVIATGAFSKITCLQLFFVFDLGFLGM